MIEMIPTGDDTRVLGLHISGPVEKADVTSVAEMMERRLEESEGRLRIYAEIEDNLELGPKALFEDLRVSMRHYRDVEREAIVADKGWLGTLARLGDLLPGIEVRHFSWAERDEALKWINA